MNEMDMMSPEKVAAKYGGDKQKIGQAAQMGLLNPTVAVMAGMFIDRMRGAAVQEQAPQSTVAQDVMTPPMAPAGLGAISQAPMEGGLEALPTPNLDNAEYAGGGIVAFAGPDGSFVQDDDMETRRLRETLRRKYAGIASPLGAFASVPASEIVGFQENRRTIQNLLGALPSLNKEQLQYMLANTPDITKVSSASPAVTSRNIDLSRDFKDTDTGVDLPQVKQPTAPAVSASKSKATEKAAAPAKEETTEDFLARRKRMLREAGASEDPFAADRAALAELKGKTGKERSEAGALALIEAGLGVAGGKSQYALQNLVGAKDALGSYAKGLRQIKEDEKEYAKMERDLSKAEDALKRGDVDKALEFEDKAESRRIQLMGVEAQRASAFRPSSQEEYLRLQRLADAGDKSAQRVLQGMFGAAKLGQVDERQLRADWDKMSPGAKMLLERNENISTFDQYKASRMGGGGGGFKVLGREGG
jgi:hypothetical protein